MTLSPSHSFAAFTALTHLDIYGCNLQPADLHDELEDVNGVAYTESVDVLAGDICSLPLLQTVQIAAHSVQNGIAILI
jgi:hypothetical protein